MLPALLGGIIGSIYTDINFVNLLIFSSTLYISFLTGISFSYYISSFYRISINYAISAATLFIFIYVSLFYKYEITGGLDWYINREIGLIFLGLSVPIILSLIATITIQEHNSSGSIKILGYKNRFEEKDVWLNTHLMYKNFI